MTEDELTSPLEVIVHFREQGLNLNEKHVQHLIKIGEIKLKPMWKMMISGSQPYWTRSPETPNE